MKFISFLIIITGILMNDFNLYATDISSKPEPMKETGFVFPKHTEHVLKNGLKVFLIEDHEQPTVSFSILIPGGTSQDGKNPGTADIVAGLLTKGTGKLTALDIANKIDGLGSSINAGAGGDYITVSSSVLKKHMTTLLDVFSQVVTNPKFDEDEFDKFIKQMAAGLQYDKSQPNKLAATLARRVIYGDNHPYALSPTEKTIEKIEIEDIKAFYKKFFVPNNASIAVVGDVKEKEIIPILEKIFANWKKGEKPTIVTAEPKPQPLGVYFINRPASEQSTVVVTTLGVPYNHKDYENLDMTAKVIGSGFGGRLFRTLRETYSYTYTPWGYLTSSKYINRFACGADVNKSKTDSSLNVIIKELKLLAEKGPSVDELARHIKYETGQFYLAFENSNFVASLVQQADFLDIPLEKVKDFPKRIKNLIPADIERAANDYIDVNSARIIVVGDPSIKESLKSFGNVFDYDLDLLPLTGPNSKLDKVSLSPAELIEKHTKAIGGKDNIEKVQSLKAVSTTTMISNNQPMTGELIQFKDKSGRMHMIFDMKMFKQEIWNDGKNIISGGMGDNTSLDGQTAEKIRLESQIFGTTKLLDLNYKLEIKGKKNGSIIVGVTSPLGEEFTYYFDEKTLLVSKYEAMEETPYGMTLMSISFSNWKNINGVMLATTINNVSTAFSLNNEYTYEINVPIEDSMFTP